MPCPSATLWCQEKTNYQGNERVELASSAPQSTISDILKKIVVLPAVACPAIANAIDPLLLLPTYSSLTRLLRITAWTPHFVNDASSPRETVMGLLKSTQLWAAPTFWIRHAQRECFPTQKAALEASETLPKI